MLPDLFNATTIPVLEQVASFAQARQEVLAGNIANLDTPGYRVRDLSVETFQKRLRDVIEANKQFSQPRSPGELFNMRDEAMRRVEESMTTLLYHDDSNVGIEQQVTTMAKNQYMHNLAISLMSSQFRLLQSVVSEQV